MNCSSNWCLWSDADNGTQTVAARGSAFFRITPICPAHRSKMLPFSLPIGAGSNFKIPLERFAKGNLRVVADRKSDLNKCRRACSQHSGSLRKTDTGYVLHWRFAYKIFEL